MDYEEVKRKIQQIARMSNRAIDLLPLMNSIDQLESDAEHWRNVKKAFEQGKVLYSYAEIGNYFLMDTEQDLLEWAKEVEK